MTSIAEVAHKPHSQADGHAEPSPPPNVYQCIANVCREVAKRGIGKTSVNQQQGYKFRGIDAVANVLAPILAEQGLLILPRVMSREMTERVTAKGGVLFSVIENVEFTFVSAHDSSTHVCSNYGEGMDSADKATNKALTAAYKYLLNIALCIPTEGDNDADATTHELAGKRPAVDASTGEILEGPKPVAPPGYGPWFDGLTAAAREGTAMLKQYWRESAEPNRNFLMESSRDKWEAMKAAAASVKTEVPA